MDLLVEMLANIGILALEVQLLDAHDYSNKSVCRLENLQLLAREALAIAVLKQQ
jgi:hypothetical protein